MTGSESSEPHPSPRGLAPHSFQAGLLACLHPPPTPSHAIFCTVASCRIRQAYSSGGLRRNGGRGNRQRHRLPVSPRSAVAEQGHL